MRQPDSMQLLNTLQQLLTLEATDVRETSTQMANLLVKTFNADKVDVFLYHPEVEQLIAEGTSETPMGHRQRALGLHILPVVDGGRTAHIFQTSKSFVTGHVEQDPIELEGIKWDLGVRSLMGVPLVVAGEKRGVLLISSATAEAYTSETLRFLEAVTRWVGDVTHRAELVERIQDETRLRIKQATAEEIVTILAHDFKTVLASLGLRFASLRRHTWQSGHEESYLRVLEAEQPLRHLRAFTDSLLDVARLEHGIFALQKECKNVSKVVYDVVDTLQTDGVSITVDVDPDLEITLDTIRFDMALTNLISNALLHNTVGQSIEVTVTSEPRDEQECLVVAVTDHGQGIDATLLPHLFERYAAGRQSPGLGIGLYIARQIAEAHGGTLTVTTSSEGSTFYFAIPTEPEPERANKKPI